MTQSPILADRDRYYSNTTADFRASLRDAAVRLLGTEADRIFATWAQIDPATLDLLLRTARDMNMQEEILALGLWRLAEGGHRPELDLDDDWGFVLFDAARETGLCDVAFLLYNWLREQKKGAANRLIDMAFLYANSGSTKDALELLKSAKPSYMRRQILLETQIERDALDAGVMLFTLLRDFPAATQKRLWKMRPAIGRTKVAMADERLLHFIIDTCHDEALPFILACAVDIGRTSDINRKVLTRILNDGLFWSAIIGQTPADARYRSMAELSAIYLRAGLSGVALAEDNHPSFEATGPLPHLTASSLMMRPSDEKVAVILCAYNAQDTIEHALRSICRQGHENLSIVVVDDCSPEPLRLDPAWFMGRDVSLHRNKTNLGPYLSRNIGIDLTDADVIGFHDADDWMHPDKISHQLSELDQTNAVAHYGAVIRIRPDGLITPENNGQFLGDGPITGIFRREAFIRAGRFANVRTRGDIEFRRRLTTLLGAEAVIRNTIPYVLALDWDSNSKQMTKKWSDWQKIRNFLNHSQDVLSLTKFMADPETLHEVINLTMPLSLRSA